MIIIKKAEPGNIEELSLLFDSYRQFYNQAPDLYGAKTFMLQRIKNNESVIFIAFNDEEAIGFTQLYPIFSSVSMQKAWLLNDLYVNSNIRKKGVGTKLLDAAKQHAAETRAKWLLLSTGKDNHAAQSVYENNGWKRVTDVYYEFVLPE
jgi:GNAT superfamily N-acetyltransferase